MCQQIIEKILNEKNIQLAKEKITGPSSSEVPKLKKTSVTFSEKPVSTTYHTESQDPDKIYYHEQEQPVESIVYQKTNDEFLYGLIVKPYCWYLIKLMINLKAFFSYKNSPNETLKFQETWKVLNLRKSIFAITENFTKFLRFYSTQFSSAVQTVLLALNQDIVCLYQTTVVKLNNKLPGIKLQIDEINKSDLNESKKVAALDQIVHQHRIEEIKHILNQMSNVSLKVELVYKHKLTAKFAKQKQRNKIKIVHEFQQAASIYYASSKVKKMIQKKQADMLSGQQKHLRKLDTLARRLMKKISLQSQVGQQIQIQCKLKRASTTQEPKQAEF